MTLPQNVKDAVDRVNHCELHSFDADWQTIRAHLMSQDESITNLRSAAQKAVLASAYLRVRAELAESRLAAANALLRDIVGFRWFVTRAPFTTEEIHAHLQGAGDA